jgi:hypothetical protein
LRIVNKFASSRRRLQGDFAGRPASSRRRLVHKSARCQNLVQALRASSSEASTWPRPADAGGVDRGAVTEGHPDAPSAFALLARARVQAKGMILLTDPLQCNESWPGSRLLRVASATGGGASRTGDQCSANQFHCEQSEPTFLSGAQEVQGGLEIGSDRQLQLGACNPNEDRRANCLRGWMVNRPPSIEVLNPGAGKSLEATKTTAGFGSWRGKPDNGRPLATQEKQSTKKKHTT